LKEMRNRETNHCKHTIQPVVTDIKIHRAVQGSRTIKPTKLEAFRDGYMRNVEG
jgi:hypothetical protein